jgi:hypothetical protein
MPAAGAAAAYAGKAAGVGEIQPASGIFAEDNLSPASFSRVGGPGEGGGGKRGRAAARMRTPGSQLRGGPAAATAAAGAVTAAAAAAPTGVGAVCRGVLSGGEPGAESRTTAAAPAEGSGAPKGRGRAGQAALERGGSAGSHPGALRAMPGGRRRRR